MLAAGRGITLQANDLRNLRQIHTGSAPVREPGLQLAYRFRDQDWGGSLVLQRERSTVLAEICHLGFIGEGTLYGSSVFTYQIGGAPVGHLVLTADPAMQNLEFTGRDIVDWKRLEDRDGRQRWQVNFRDKLFGEYTLLVTGEMKLAAGESRCRFGDLATEGADAEHGFIILSSVRNLQLSGDGGAESVHEIEAAELPQDYRRLVHNPIRRAYRFTRSPHWTDVVITPFADQPMLDIAVDHAMLATRIDRNGETVTQAQYRIKNASRQFLAVTLPEGAKLWTVKVNDELRRVSETGPGHYLIPLPRNDDRNEPIAVFLEYAQVFTALGGRSALTLAAPGLGLETLLTRWRVDIPETYHFTAMGGSLTTEQRPETIGLAGVLARLLRWARHLAMPAMLGGWALAALGGLLLAWSWGRRRLRILLSCLGAILLLAGGAAILGSLGDTLLRRALVNELRPVAVTSGEFVKLFSLPDDALRVELEVADMAGMSAGRLGLALAAGLGAAACLWLARRRRRGLAGVVLAGMGLALILAGLSQWLEGNLLLGFGLVLLLPAAFTALGWAAVFRHARRKAAALAALLALAWLPTAQAGGIVIHSAAYELEVGEDSVSGTASYEIEAEEPGRIRLIGAPAALSGDLPADSGMVVQREDRDYHLDVRRRGRHRFQFGFLLPLEEVERNSRYRFSLDLPSCLRNQVRLRLGRRNFVAESAQAVAVTHAVEDGLYRAEMTFVPGVRAEFLVRPQTRDVEKETLAYFAQTDALAKFAAGVVEVEQRLRVSIAQGELSRLSARVPANMRVTAVTAPDLGAWRYDPAAHRLELLFTRPHHGTLDIVAITQIANCTLPYRAEVGFLDLPEAGRQHGAVALVPDDAVQVQVEDSAGFSPINAEDIAPAFRLAQAAVKRAFRFHGAPGALTVSAVGVEPEIRVDETCRLSFEEERTRLVSDLTLDVAKAGVFSLALALPAEFDVDRIAGDAVRHWDEIVDDEGHRVLIHFDRRLLGETRLRVELSMMERQPSRERDLPRLAVAGARKHKGSLEVVIEPGVRMEVIARQGVEIQANAFRRDAAPSHRFGIVRPDWSLRAAFEVTEPWLQVEDVQVARVADGAVDRDSRFLFTVENTGVKRFRIRLPEGAETPEFTGRNIVGVQALADGAWEVELHQRVTGRYLLSCRFRQPWEGGATLALVPAAAVGAEQQKGYCVVLAGDSLEVAAAERSGELADFDARKLPPELTTEPLANAVLCYRTVGADYRLGLAVTRHRAARLLPARIEGLDLVSTVSGDGRLITHGILRLQNGNETFLRMTLPAGAALWSVLIDEQPVEVAREAGRLLIPLRQATGGGLRAQAIRFVYSQPQGAGWSARQQRYQGPVFDSALRDVTWRLFLPADFRYGRFAGSLDYLDDSFIRFLAMDLHEYDQVSREATQRNRQQARQLLQEANRKMAVGDQETANEMFQSAYNLALTDKALNADIQGQWIAHQRDQSVSAFASRRGGGKAAGKGRIVPEAPAPVQQQQVDEPQAPLPQQANDLVQRLGGAEVRNLQQISDKIFLQQQAAAAVPQPLDLSIPEGGRLVRFHRPLQVNADAPIEVSFAADPAISLREHPAWIAFLAFAAVFALLVALARAALGGRAGGY